MSKSELIGIRQTRVIESPKLVPYSTEDSMVVETDQVRLPRADRTLTRVQRYKIKEAKRDGSRVNGGVIVDISGITGRSKIGQIRS